MIKDPIKNQVVFYDCRQGAVSLVLECVVDHVGESRVTIRDKHFGLRRYVVPKNLYYTCAEAIEEIFDRPNVAGVTYSTPDGLRHAFSRKDYSW